MSDISSIQAALDNACIPYRSARKLSKEPTTVVTAPCNSGSPGMEVRFEFVKGTLRSISTKRVNP